MKKRVVIIGVAAMLVIAVIVAVVLAVIFTREGVVVKSGSSSVAISYVKNDTWTTTASSVNGNYRVDKTFDSGNLASFHASSTNSIGKIVLKLIQGDVEKSIDITGEFNDKIDMSEFEPGRIRLRLEFEHATDLSISVSWK